MAGNLSHARRTGASDDRQRRRPLTRRPDLDVGVRTRLETVTVTVWGNLGEFFDGLARDFRGWEGERVWANNHLVVTAARPATSARGAGSGSAAGPRSARGCCRVRRGPAHQASWSGLNLPVAQA
ncbi:DUF6228 family protein [Streptomyces sp. NPDC056309]